MMLEIPEIIAGASAQDLLDAVAERVTLFRYFSDFPRVNTHLMLWAINVGQVDTDRSVSIIMCDVKCAVHRHSDLVADLKAKGARRLGKSRGFFVRELLARVISLPKDTSPTGQNKGDVSFVPLRTSTSPVMVHPPSGMQTSFSGPSTNLMDVLEYARSSSESSNLCLAVTGMAS